MIMFGDDVADGCVTAKTNYVKRMNISRGRKGCVRVM